MKVSKYFKLKELPDIRVLCHSSKDRLILDQWEEIKRLREEIRQLKESPGKSPKKINKSSKNSSLPPSKDFKGTQDNYDPKPRSRHHHKGGKNLSLSVTEKVLLKEEHCSDCASSLVNQKLQSLYDRYDIPPLEPTITRVERYQAYCPACKKTKIAPLPHAWQDGSHFGSGVQALACYLRYEHAISYQRLVAIFKEIFGVELSEGSICNMLKRLEKPLEESVQGILERIRESDLICSDETSARINGQKQWEWVFQNSEVCYHLIKPSRGSEVKEDVMAGNWPKVWVSDLFGAQTNNKAQTWQACLAHQLRDCQYGIDKGDDVFSEKMKSLLKKALTSQYEDIETYPHNLSLFKAELEKLLKLKTTHPDGKRLQKRYSKIRDKLFVFLEEPGVPPTNNSSEQALRMSVIFRKVTNGFRSEWGKDFFAMIRSVINTGKRNQRTSFQTIAQLGKQPVPT